MTPLTDEQILDLYDITYQELVERWRNNEGGIFKIEFVRALERIYGIGELK